MKQLCGRKIVCEIAEKYVIVKESELVYILVELDETVPGGYGPCARMDFDKRWAPALIAGSAPRAIHTVFSFLSIAAETIEKFKAEQELA